MAQNVDCSIKKGNGPCEDASVVLKGDLMIHNMKKAWCTSR